MSGWYIFLPDGPQKGFVHAYFGASVRRSSGRQGQSFYFNFDLRRVRKKLKFCTRGRRLSKVQFSTKKRKRNDLCNIKRILHDMGSLTVARCYHDIWHLLKMVQGKYIWSFVKIGSVTAEIFLMWTNVTRTNVACTNVTITVGICYRCSQDPTFKSGQ